MSHETISGPCYKSILSSLERVLDNLPPGEYPGVIGELERLKVIAHIKMFRGLQQAPTQPVEGKYLTIAEVAEKFHVSPKWLYRHKKQIPHSQPSRKLLLFPEKSIEKWFASLKCN